MDKKIFDGCRSFVWSAFSSPRKESMYSLVLNPNYESNITNISHEQIIKSLLITNKYFIAEDLNLNYSIIQFVQDLSLKAFARSRAQICSVVKLVSSLLSKIDF